MMTILSLFGCGKTAKEIKDIKYFSFNYSVGYYANANWSYVLELKDGAWAAEVKPNGVAPEDAEKYTVGEDFVRSLEDFLKEKKVGAWDGFDKADKYVLDGDSFSLYIRMTDDQSVSASGYMEWPEGYKEVQGGIDALFRALRPGQ